MGNTRSGTSLRDGRLKKKKKWVLLEAARRYATAA